MAKFVIECPSCGNYTQANSGLFGFIGRTKKVDCSCGFTIDVKTERLSSRQCPKCGNHVVFDITKGEKAKCPVCGEAINTRADMHRNVEFSCAQCGIRLQTSKDTKFYTCPICDHENPVAERVLNEEIKAKGHASVIRYEGDNETLVWKHPVEDFLFGSQLIVHESQEAIFFRDGQALDLFGAGRYTLETQQLPLLDKFYELPAGTENVFHSEVYYVNMATQMGIKWGTDTKIRLFDPLSGLHVELGASGECNIRVINSRKLLLKLIGTTKSLKQDQLLGNNGKSFFRTMIMTQVKSDLAATIREKNISVLEIDSRLLELSEALRERINTALFNYGLEMPEFFVSRVVTPDDDPNFRRMKQQYAEQYLAVREEQIRKNVAVAEAERKAVEAKTAAQMKIIGAQGDAEALKIQKAAEAEAYRMQAAAEAEEMRMKGYTYQQETMRQVGLEAMQNGITGGEGGMMGGLGDLASLGITLGTMGSMVNMTKDALSPVMDTASQMGKAVGGVISGTMTNAWDCTCGNKGITAKFCGECGAKRPEAVPVMTWTCPQCGCTGITAKFCGECGTKCPETAVWDCPQCGNKGITGKFCGECGQQKGE